MKHRWGEKSVVSLQKTERECVNGCGIVKVTRHETEAGRDLHWVEFWRGLECIGGKITPVCEPVEMDSTTSASRQNSSAAAKFRPSADERT